MKESGLMLKDAIVKAFNKKVGVNKTKLTVLAPLTPELARALKVHSAVYQQDNTPKQEILEVELDVRKAAPFDFRLEVPTLPQVLHVPSCDEASDWVAKRKGSTKKGQASRLLIEFRVTFNGSAIGVFEWLEKYGQAPGQLTMSATAPEQQDLKGDDVRVAAERAQEKAGKGKANGAAAGAIVQ